MDILLKFLAPGILLLLTLVFGLWVSLSGKPYNGILFNIHKLIALATLVVTAIQITRLLKGTPVPVLPIVLISLAGLCVLALFFTGAMMSAGKLDYPAMLAVHRTTIIIVIIEIAGAAYYLPKII